MIRYLLLRHPALVILALVFAAMFFVRHSLAPLIVHNFGLAGTLGFIGGMIALAGLIERSGY